MDCAISRLVQHLEKNHLDTLDPAQVPELLSRLGVVEMFGLQAEATPPPATPAPPSSARQQPADPAQIERAKRVGDDIRKRQETRKNAAAVTPAGAGSTVAGTKPPKGQRFEERVSWLRKNLGI